MKDLAPIHSITIGISLALRYPIQPELNRKSISTKSQMSCFTISFLSFDYKDLASKVVPKQKKPKPRIKTTTFICNNISFYHSFAQQTLKPKTCNDQNSSEYPQRNNPTVRITHIPGRVPLLQKPTKSDMVLNSNTHTFRKSFISF